MHVKLKYYEAIRTSMQQVSPRSPAANRERVRIRADSQFLRPPSALLPASLFVLGGSDDSHTQSSLNTISSIINTMMGTTIVALPLGFAQCGIVLGLIITVAMCLISCATCIIVINNAKGIPEFSALVGRYGGRYWQAVAWVMSIMVFLGAACVYHILMQESLFSIVSTIGEVSAGEATVEMSWWSRPLAAAIICGVFPALVMKDLSCLVRVNAFGFFALWFTIFFVCYHGVLGLMSGNYDMEAVLAGPLVAAGNLEVASVARLTFGPLGGMMMLSFFIHNAIQPITENAAKATRARDVAIAYSITAVLYSLVGVLGCFGYAAILPAGANSDGVLKSNFLDMFGTTFSDTSNVLAFVARAALLFQLITVYPILIMVIRNSFFGVLFQSNYPSCLHVSGLVVVVMGLTYTVAALDVDVGSAVRFTGAVGGYVIVFILPCVVDYFVKLSSDKLRIIDWIFYVAVLGTGLTFFALQFVPAISP